jgi:hypothetical protein
MFDPRKMSPAELAFVRQYVRALRRDYWELKTTIALMAEDGLAVQDVTRAAKAARALRQQHTAFEAALSANASLDKFRRGPKRPDNPSLDDVADMFSLSFFKVLASIKTKTTTKKIDNGWFSGEPNAWQSVLNKMQKYISKFDNTDLSDCMKNIAKLFPSWGPPTLSFGPDDETTDTPLNFWPKDALGGTLGADDEDDWYGDEDDEEPEEEL